MRRLLGAAMALLLASPAFAQLAPPYAAPPPVPGSNGQAVIIGPGGAAPYGSGLIGPGGAASYSDTRITGAVQIGAPVDTNTVKATGSSANRKNADRAADRLTVNDFGAKFDGTDDYPAFNAARGAAPANGIIGVPPGPVKVLTTPTNGPSFVLWQMSGNAYAGGANPVLGVGTDWVENFLGNAGGKYIGRGATTQDSAPVTRVGMTVSHSGGTTGFVMPASQSSCVIADTGLALNNYVWCNQTQLTSYAIGPGQHVATAGRAVRPADALADGQGPRSVIWGGYLEVADLTEQAANIAGPLVADEVDIFANAADPNNQRIGIDLEIQRQDTAGVAARVGTGMAISSYNDGSAGYAMANRSYVGVGYALKMPFDTAGFDTSKGLSVASAPAYRMATNQTIDLAGDNSQVMYYDGAGNLRYDNTTGGTTNNVFRLSNGGTITAGNTLLTFNNIAFNVIGSTNVGYDTTNATLSGAAFRMNTNQFFALEATSAITMRYNSNAIRFRTGSTDLLTIDTAGNVAMPGALTPSGALKLSTATGLSAAGTTQATATALTKDVSAVTTVTSGSGVLLQANIGQRQEVFNRGTNALLVYPALGEQIEANAVNASVSLAVGGHAVFECVTATQCYQAP